MNLKKQLQELIDNGLKFDISPVIFENAIIPALVKLAKPFKNSHFYVWENSDDQFVVTVLENRANPKLRKRVIYAFSSFAIAENFAENFLDYDPQTMEIVEIPVTHLFFHTVGIKAEALDSLIFVKQQGNNLQFQELECKDIKRSIQEKFQKAKSLLEPSPNTRLV